MIYTNIFICNKVKYTAYYVVLLGVLTLYYECTVVHILNIVLIKQSIIKYSLNTKMNQLNRQVDIKHPQPDDRHLHLSSAGIFSPNSKRYTFGT